jgi:hypothetical protein
MELQWMLRIFKNYNFFLPFGDYVGSMIPYEELIKITFTILMLLL